MWQDWIAFAIYIPLLPKTSTWSHTQEVLRLIGHKALFELNQTMKLTEGTHINQVEHMSNISIISNECSHREKSTYSSWCIRIFFKAPCSCQMLPPIIVAITPLLPASVSIIWTLKVVIAGANLCGDLKLLLPIPARVLRHQAGLEGFWSVKYFR